ncbi:hypothetical protein [uncultured Sulfitobacter sp.]|uniref:hypothetical protein n=1 Tax=uncultured Sulfitobacter sp. TaxID=191468 RepID=UPI0026187A98|nr:hypothetical protein [uncultured Sulfitobacter sp.]
MAALSSGALSVTPDSCTLSGTTSGDATTLRTAIANREGWSAIVSAPTVETSLNAQVENLNAIIGTLTTERDSLNDTQTNTANLAGELDRSKTALALTTAQLVEKDAVIKDLTGQISTLIADVAALTEEIKAQKASVSSDQQSGAELTSKITALEADLADASAKTAMPENDLADETAERYAVQDRLSP